jgi:hypothetical protein
MPISERERMLTMTSTVSYVLNGKEGRVSEETRLWVLAAELHTRLVERIVAAGEPTPVITPAPPT